MQLDVVNAIWFFRDCNTLGWVKRDNTVHDFIISGNVSCLYHIIEHWLVVHKSWIRLMHDLSLPIDTDNTCCCSWLCSEQRRSLFVDFLFLFLLWLFFWFRVTVIVLDFYSASVLIAISTRQWNWLHLDLVRNFQFWIRCWWSNSVWRHLMLDVNQITKELFSGVFRIFLATFWLNGFLVCYICRRNYIGMLFIRLMIP